MSYTPLLQQLIEALRCLPGVGPKSAQRMTFHLLERDPEGALRLAKALTEAVERVGRCDSCRTLSEAPLCPLCASQRRDRRLLCVVETPADVLAVEQSGAYAGLYFVLGGHLSPLDGIGPEEIGVDALLARAREGVEEVILATNPTVEGEATAHYIGELLREQGVGVSRIAHGVPLGGELEYVDGSTLTRALAGRKPI
ncbi:recombination mediator RecR [Thioalbus denitrificans]|uniref:Recombination protein RecR n=1 Tax=Thioalbus denitrificans TaxID=547122 RepID=A0A369C7C3_9GAMM|nr:recombination mediator RecR [Thioalbus denitrificans]RCX29912.1 DNA replication and repair protein RecR [Thioalbus denitrificans]